MLKLNNGRKACKDFPKFTLIFPCKQENVAFVKRIRVLFFRKAKALYGMALVLFLQFPSSGVPKDQRHLDTMVGQLQLSSILM